MDPIDTEIILARHARGVTAIRDLIGWLKKDRDEIPGTAKGVAMAAQKGLEQTLAVYFHDRVGA